MDLRTWQEAGVRDGSYSARHRARSPFSPLRPAPIAIGSLSTAAIAAFAFVAPGLLHGGGASAGTQLLDGMPNRVAPLSPGSGGAAPAFVSVTAPSSSSTSDSPATPTSTSTSEGGTSSSSSSPSPLAVHSSSTSPEAPRPTRPQPSQSQAPTSAPTSPGTPTAPPTTTRTPVPVTPPPTAPTVPGTTFNSSAAASSALAEIGTARSQQGVSSLSVDSLLSSAAHVHAVDMARTGDFSHIGSDGSDPFSRAADLGCFRLTQELIAHGRPGDDVIGALMQDPSSRRALLSFWNTSIGISAQLDRATGDVYWTIELGWG